MPLTRDGWLWGPRVGFNGIGRLVAKPAEQRFSELYLLPGDRELYDELLRVSKGGASWVLAKDLAPRHAGYLHLVEAKLEHVPGVSLRSLTGRSRELPPAVVCGVLAKVARAFVDSPPPDARVTPDGVWIGWDGSVRVTPFPLCLLNPHTESPEPADDSWSQTATAGRNLARLLEFALHRLGRVPAPVLKLLAAEPAAGTPDEEFLRELAAGLEAQSGDTRWLERELGSLFAPEKQNQRSLEVIASGGHPDEIPEAIREQVLARRDDESFAVLADHLESTGRPRGRLARLQQQKPSGWQGAVDELFTRYRELSPLDQSAVPPQPIKFEWEWGWVKRIHVTGSVAPFSLHWVLDHPACIFARELTVTSLGRSCREAIKAVTDLDHCPLQTLELAELLGAASEALRSRRPELKLSQVPHLPIHEEFDAAQALAISQGLRWVPGRR